MVRWLPFTIGLLIFICSCNNGKDQSPYKELLSKQPYAPLTDSIDHDPKNADLYYRRAILLRKNDNPPAALADLKKAWLLQPREEYAVLISSLLADQPDSAATFINAALKQFPQSIALKLSLAQSYAAADKTEEAIKVCDEVIAQQHNQLDALELKADLLEEKNDTTGSIALLERAYTIAPFDEQLCYNLANKYAQSKNPKVLKLADSLIQTDSSQPEPYYFKGTYYQTINNPAKAISLFEQAILHDYTFLDAYMGKGKTLYDRKQYNEAIRVFQLALKISSTYADAYYWLGQCEEAIGLKDDAKLNYLRAYGLDKSFTEAKEAADRLK